MKTCVLNTSDSSMIAGYWEATLGTYYATHTDHEFVHVIAGKMINTPDGGEPVLLEAGDVFVVELGFTGHWKIVETIRKHFAIKP